MNNFAERVVARSAGAPLGPGVSLLAPRPASRFEPVAAIAAEDAPVDARSAVREYDGRTPADLRSSSEMYVEQQAPAPGEAARGAPSPNVHWRQQNLEEGVEVENVEAQVAAARRGPDGAGAPAVAPQPWSAGADIDKWPPSFRRSGKELSPSDILPRSSALRDAGTEQRMTGSVARLATMREEKVEQAPPATISIGKIEVQFLPQEQPMPTPRLEPQQTRGFEAYARARRGEPR